MNNYQQEISNIFEKASDSIQIAVSWFTDEVLINKLINKAELLHIELLLSSDEVNILRHKNFRELQSVGAIVKKIGSEDAIQGDFMHSKFIIIDKKYAFGGSYNFTNNARSNFENFNRLEKYEVNKVLVNFENWFKNSIDFFYGISDANSIVKKLKQKFIESTKRKSSIINRVRSSISFPEQEYIQNKETELSQTNINNTISSIFANEVKKDIKKDKLQKTARKLVDNTNTINSNGEISKSKDGIISKAHRFYGGAALSKFKGQKKKNSYGLAYNQKRNIENSFNFISCNIQNDTLLCKGIIQLNNCDKYIIKIEYRAGYSPNVYILSPDIGAYPDIHIYKDGSLCLFYPPDLKWKDTTNIARYTIPWVIEWILFYEIWKLTGEWEGVEKSHETIIPNYEA